MGNSQNIIVHYHLFKNAGTSVDHLLKRNFGDKWIGFDGESPGSIITTEALENTINSTPDKLVFSSHQIVPPLPDVGKNVFPVVFLRDPVDRIKSAYLFEWKKQLGLDFPKGTLKEYVEKKFTYKRKSSVEEFQTIRLSNTKPQAFHDESISDDELVERACHFIGSLDFVGIVDEFDRSMLLLTGYLSQAFPGFEYVPVKANVLQDTSLDQKKKREIIQDELGQELFEMIVERNRLDEKLYQYGRRHLEHLENQQKEAV